jgi:Fe-S oxidoreductase
MFIEEHAGTIHRCFRCGYCRLTGNYAEYNCPMYARFGFETYSPGGLLWLLRAWMQEDIKWSDYLAKILYSCTACNNCVEHCKFEFNVDIVNIFLAARREMVADGLVLPKVAHFFRNVETTGNPYHELRAERDKWAEGSGIPPYSGQEFLYYIGCVGSFDTRSQGAARALGEVLLKAGVSFGILGSREECDGNEVNVMGEKRIFDMLAEKNLSVFDQLRVEKIVTLSPHAYNAFKHYYPNKFQVFHYTQLLRDLIREGKLSMSKGSGAKVTYHDPCFLGRHNQEYEAPREILNAIPGTELIEMERNKEDSPCCGGGSGNFYVDSFGGKELSPARIRVREAYQTGASTLVVACPICLTMLNDALKGENLEEELAVKDISEIVQELF